MSGLAPRRHVAPRTPTDRATINELHIANHSTMTRGVEVTIDGLGRCAFVAYTRHNDGAEWVDVITARGFARTVRPERITRVHRSRRLAVLSR